MKGGDAREVRLLYGYYDCENLAALRGRRSAWNPLGNLTREEPGGGAEDSATAARGGGTGRTGLCRPEGEMPESVDTAQRFEQELFGAYYAACARSRSRFLRRGPFSTGTCATLRRPSARATGRSIEDSVVGGGDVAEQLQRSSAADFGLRGELPYIDAVIAAVNDEANLVEKERKIDLIRWNGSRGAGDLRLFRRRCHPFLPGADQHRRSLDAARRGARPRDVRPPAGRTGRP